MVKEINVELIYALPEEQIILSLNVDDGTEVQEVILQSGILQQYPEIDLEKNKVGIFGKMTKLTQHVREKDRIEIYRALIADPKEVRKRRAAEGKALKKGGANAASKAKK